MEILDACYTSLWSKHDAHLNLHPGSIYVHANGQFYFGPEIVGTEDSIWTQATLPYNVNLSDYADDPIPVDRLSYDVYAVCGILLEAIESARTGSIRLHQSYTELEQYLREVRRTTPHTIASYRVIGRLQDLIGGLCTHERYVVPWAGARCTLRQLLDLLPGCRMERDMVTSAVVLPWMRTTIPVTTTTMRASERVYAAIDAVARSNRPGVKFCSIDGEDIIEVYRDYLDVRPIDLTDHRSWFDRLRTLARRVNATVVPPVESVTTVSYGTTNYVGVRRSYLPEHQYIRLDVMLRRYRDTFTEGDVRGLVAGLMTGLSTSFWALEDTAHHDLHPGNILVRLGRLGPGPSYEMAFIDYVVGTRFLAHPVHEDYGYTAAYQYTEGTESARMDASDVFAVGQILLDILGPPSRDTEGQQSRYMCRLREVALDIRGRSPYEQISAMDLVARMHQLTTDSTRGSMGLLGSTTPIPLMHLAGMLDTRDTNALRVSSRNLLAQVPANADILSFPVSHRFLLTFLRNKTKTASERTLVVQHLNLHYNTQQFLDEQQMGIGMKIQSIATLLRGIYTACVITRCTARLSVWITPRYVSTSSRPPYYASSTTRRVYEQTSRHSRGCDLYIKPDERVVLKHYEFQRES